MISNERFCDETYGLILETGSPWLINLINGFLRKYFELYNIMIRIDDLSNIIAKYFICMYVNCKKYGLTKNRRDHFGARLDLRIRKCFVCTNI